MKRKLEHESQLEVFNKTEDEHILNISGLEKHYQSLSDLARSIKNHTPIENDSFALYIAAVNYLNPILCTKKSLFYIWLKKEDPRKRLVHLLSYLNHTSNTFAKISLPTGKELTLPMHLLMEVFIHLAPKSPQIIAEFLYHFGLSANLFEKKLDNALLQKLLARLNNEDLCSEHLYKSIYGIKLLVCAHQLQDKFDISCMQNPLDIVLSKGWDPLMLHCFCILGDIGETSDLQGSLCLENLQQSLTTLSASNDNLVGKIVYKIGYFASLITLQNKLSMGCMQNLLDILIAKEDLTNKEIINFISGLGFLALWGNLHGKLDVGRLQKLLDLLLAKGNLDEKDMKHLIYNIGNLGRANALKNKFAVSFLETLIDTILVRVTTELLIKDTFFTLKTLKKKDLVEGNVNNLALRVLTASHSLNLSLPCINIILNAMAELDVFPPEIYLSQLIQKVQLKQQPLNQVIYIIKNLGRFKQYSMLDSLFMQFISYVINHFQAFSLDLQKQLSDNLHLFTDKPSWHKAVQDLLTKNQGQKEERTLKKKSTQLKKQIEAQDHVPNIKPNEWNTAKNELFLTISTGSLSDLQCLLELERSNLPQPRLAFLQQSQSKPSLFHQTKNKTLSATISTLIYDFLKNTPTKEMRQLIESTNYLKFSVFFQGCGRKLCYDLTLNHLLDPIWIYLPLNELKLLVEHMISPHQFYCHSQVVLSLMNTLTTRASQNTHEAEEIKKLQIHFFHCAINYHKLQGNTHVLHSLRSALKKLHPGQEEQSDIEDNQYTEEEYKALEHDLLHSAEKPAQKNNNDLNDSYLTAMHFITNKPPITPKKTVSKQIPQPLSLNQEHSSDEEHRQQEKKQAKWVIVNIPDPSEKDAVCQFFYL